METCPGCKGYGSVRIYSGRFSNATCQICKGDGEVTQELYQELQQKKAAEFEKYKQRFNEPKD